MSDFLIRLAQRSQGAAAIIEPRLPGLFEPVADAVAPSDGAAVAATSAGGKNPPVPGLAPNPNPEPEHYEAKRLVRTENTSPSQVAHSPFKGVRPMSIGQSPPDSREETEHSIISSQSPFQPEDLATIIPNRSESDEIVEHPVASFSVPLLVEMPLGSVNGPAHGDGVHHYNACLPTNSPLTGVAPRSVSPNVRSEESVAPSTSSFGATTRAHEEELTHESWVPLVPDREAKIAEDRNSPSVFDIPGQERPTVPTVHITIGRIEVRANIASAPAAPRPRAETKPTLSLGEYLKRGGGA